MNTEKRDFEKEYLDAKAEYDALGEKIAKLSDKETSTLKEAIQKSDKIIKLLNKRLKMHDKQRKRTREEMEYNRLNGITEIVKSRHLDDNF